MAGLIDYRMGSGATKGKESKRQQARNERALQDLIKGVPGNDACADCGSSNPAWASWSLGIFLCMRCAAIHRKLGTHISKVKSLSMDSWTADQVETMRRIGNTASNRQYNPRNKRPPMPIDADEADSAMERFIREKYANVEPQAAQDTRATSERPSRARVNSHSSDEAQRPDPPPKPTSKFRSMLGMSNKSSKKEREAAAQAHIDAQSHNSRGNDRHAATRADEMSPERLNENLAVLRDMGFRDEKKNKTILKGLNGNLQKTIDTLVRLGESSGPSSRSRSPMPTRGVSSAVAATANGKNHEPSNNPWAISDAAPLQSAQSTGNAMTKSTQSTNPFDTFNTSSQDPFAVQPSQSHAALHQQYELSNQLQSLSVQSQQQPLFPNRTGGIPNVQPLHNMGNPMPSIAQGQYQSFQPPMTPQSSNPFMQQQPQLAQHEQTSNPYMSNQRSATFPLAQQQQQQQQHQQQAQNQTFQQQNLFQFDQNQYSTQPASNPFAHASPIPQQQTASSASNPFGAPQHQQVQYPTSSRQSQTNPWAMQSQPQQAYQQYNSQQFQAQPTPLAPQKTGIHDILALYNTPNIAPTPYTTEVTQSPAEIQAQSYFQDESQPQQQQAYISQAAQPQQGYTTQQIQPQQRSVSNPLSGYGSASNNTNPFLSGMNASAVQSNGHNGFSRESVMIGSGGWGVQNGRHSPDAFANLSARTG